MTKPRTFALVFVAGAAFVSTAASAAGFQLFEQSGSGLGNAFAGGAASAEDASTIFFNPAGMTRIPGRQLVLAGHLIHIEAEFENEGSTLGFAPIPLTGGDGGDAGGIGFVPNLYYAMDVTPNVKFGVGANAPFGLKTHYDAGWVGRYHALTSQLTTININPALAYKVNDVVSLGAGLDVLYADARLSNAIDFGTICFGTLGAGPCTGLGLTPQADDGRAEVEGDDWGYGYNLGALFAITPNTRIGVAYRSKISINIDADADFSVPASATILTAGGAFRDTSASASVDLPDYASVSLFHEISSAWAVMADLTWTNWSRFEELRVKFGNPAQPDAVTPENWDDSYKVAIGATYQHNDAWKFRAGLAHDESPVPDRFRTPRIPDEDRVWVSFGAQYKVSPNGLLDIGYTHIFVDDPELNLTSASAGNLRGEYDSSVNIFAVQYSQGF
ncbi:MAG: OmpP1/FadL family transporter [Burkholderiales bacterium]